MDEATTEPGAEPVALSRVERGLDLFAAVEAAQYAHLIDTEPPASAQTAARAAVDAFVDAFCACAEGWAAKAPMEQTAALIDLDPLLANLDTTGLGVHWAVVERAVRHGQGRSLRLPIAVVRVAARDADPVRVQLPAVIEIDAVE